jgi:hypothetical protein
MGKFVDIAVGLEKEADKLPGRRLNFSKTGELLSEDPERTDGEPLEPKFVDIAEHLVEWADALPELVFSETGELLSGTPDDPDGESIEPDDGPEPEAKR